MSNRVRLQRRVVQSYVRAQQPQSWGLSDFQMTFKVFFKALSSSVFMFMMKRPFNANTARSFSNKRKHHRFTLLCIRALFQRYIISRRVFITLGSFQQRQGPIAFPTNTHTGREGEAGRERVTQSVFVYVHVYSGEKTQYTLSSICTRVQMPACSVLKRGVQFKPLLYGGVLKKKKKETLSFCRLNCDSE